MFLPLMIAALIAQDAAPPSVASSPPQVVTVNTTNFVFGQTRLHMSGDTMHIGGTVCRRANRSLISPTRVEIDHVSATGELIDTDHAYLPRLSQREDQRCGGFGAKLKTPPQPGDIVRICLPRSHGPCVVSQ